MPITRIGLLGASRIARGAVINPAAEIENIEITRVAASSAARAQDYAAEHGIPGIEADYSALIAREDVDLVYNALPPSGHMQWSIAALQAGKDVLCEKPFAMNADQARRMIEIADKTGRTLIEAFHYRFHPLFERVLQIVRSGQIGSVLGLSGRFNVAIPFRPGELRHELAVGGGALMDLGCYPIHWVRTVMAAEPVVTSASAVQEREGVDVAMNAELEFPGNVPAQVACSMQSDLPQRFEANLTITGEKGRLIVVNPLSPHSGHELNIETETGMSSEIVEGSSTYYHQLEHVIRVLTGNAESITGGEDAIANMAVIDAIYRAAGMLPRGMTE